MFGLFRKRPPELKVKDTVPPSAAVDLSAIVPVIKAVVGHHAGQHVELPPDETPISRPFVAELIIMYAIDHPDRFEFIANRHLRECGINAEQLHDLALKNLPQRLPPVEMHGQSPCYMITAGGNMEATLLLLDAAWEDIGQYLPGQAMAVVPARDLLMVSGSDWEGAMEFLTAAAKKPLQDERYALSKTVLIRKDGRWQTYQPAN